MMPRRRTHWAAAAVAGALAAAIVAGEASGWPFLKNPLRDAMQRAAGVPVQFEGRFRLHLLWRPRLQIDHLNIASSPAVPAPHLIDGRRIELTWRWGDLWRWRQGGALKLRSLRADALDVQLVRQRDGRASWQIGRAQQAQPPATRQPLPTAGWLELADGRIVIDDALRDTHLQFELRGGEGSAQANASHGYRATVNGRLRELPLNLTVRSDGALPLLRDDDDDGPDTKTALRVEGAVGESRIAFDGHAAALLSARHLDGALRFSGPSLASVGEPLGLTLPQTPPFHLQGRINHHSGVWTLHSERLTIGRSDLAGEFRYDTRAKPPRLSGRATGTQLLLADLGPSIGAPAGRSTTAAPAAASAPGRPTAAASAPVRQAAAKPAPGRQTAPAPSRQSAAASAPGRRVLPQQRFDLPSLRAMDADVELAIDQLVLSTNAVNPLRNLRTRILLDDGVLELQKLQAQVAGGRLNGSTRLDGRVEPARWAAQLRFGDVDVAG
ncbi:MAG TPA: AsmA family protein, partial [Burkholderiaceae bacterium]